LGHFEKLPAEKQVMRSILLPEHIDEFLWRKVYLKKAGNAFDVLLTHIGERYPWQVSMILF